MRSAEEVTCPTVLLAVQVYVPWSSGVAGERTRKLSETKIRVERLFETTSSSPAMFVLMEEAMLVISGKESYYSR